MLPIDKKHLGNGIWGCCFWLGKAATVRFVPRISGNVAEGVFFLPPPIVEIAHLDGLWAGFNFQYGLMIDIAEEQEIDCSLLPRIASGIRTYCSQSVSDASSAITRTVGNRASPSAGSIAASISIRDFAEMLNALANFMDDASVRGMDVVLEF